MKLISKWSIRLAALTAVVGVVGYFLAAHAVDARAAFFVACVSAALASGIVALCAYFLNEEVDAETNLYQEHTVMWYLGLSYLAVSLAVAVAVLDGTGIGYERIALIAALVVVALLFTDAAADAPRHVCLRESGFRRRMIATPFIGPLALAIFMWRAC